MNGIDTNILVRLLTRDDEQQFNAALELVKRCSDDNPLMVNPVVMIEVIWVLESAYNVKPEVSRQLLAELLNSREFFVPETLSTQDWPRWLEAEHPDFADVVIASSNIENGCATTFTLDRRAARNVYGMELLQ